MHDNEGVHLEKEILYDLYISGTEVSLTTQFKYSKELISSYVGLYFDLSGKALTNSSLVHVDILQGNSKPN
ncbi:hypothetical protein RclHR1_00670005 [Rhizophagus clarus]|uniref:Uncharacterized protein n=1 Tax=Rhizophagus clarus TaxID=94130 RepID=A0A2Z6RZ78_9GLOM|nr:hypothetical protein RclHR1_00670005 [Rhizophagus clarus]